VISGAERVQEADFLACPVVRDFVTNHPLVASYRPGDEYEGGESATVSATTDAAGISSSTTWRTSSAHWMTAYWSQTYSAWEQIPVPIGYHNSGLLRANGA